MKSSLAAGRTFVVGITGDLVVHTKLCTVTGRMLVVQVQDIEVALTSCHVLRPRFEVCCFI